MFQPHPCQNINDNIMVFRASIQNLAWIALAPVKYRHYLDGPRKLRSLVSKWVSYNLLLNAVYWAYNPLILTSTGHPGILETLPWPPWLGSTLATKTSPGLRL